jgi:hypothetical protein
MIPNSHSPGFRPSHFGELEACIRHERKAPENPAFCERGNEVHKASAAALRQLRDGHKVALPDDPDINHVVGFNLSIVESYLVQGWTILAIEESLDLLDAEGAAITRGTLDVVLKRNRELIVCDWKTGDNKDYSAQLAGYCMAALDRWPRATSVQMLVVFSDLEETEFCNGSYQSVSDRILNLHERWSGRQSGSYTLGDQCATCSVRPDCPAWRREADRPLVAINQMADGAESNMLTARLDALKNNPAKLEQFWVKWQMLETLVKDWKLGSALLDHYQTGWQGEHYTLVEVKEREEIEEQLDPEAWLMVGTETIGAELTANVMTVDVQKAREIWDKAEGSDFPVTVSRSSKTISGYNYIRRKGQPGKGKAAKKRKKLQNI